MVRCSSHRFCRVTGLPPDSSPSSFNHQPEYGRGLLKAMSSTFSDVASTAKPWISSVSIKHSALPITTTASSGNGTAPPLPSQIHTFENIRHRDIATKKACNTVAAPPGKRRSNSTWRPGKLRPNLERASPMRRMGPTQLESQPCPDSLLGSSLHLGRAED